MALSKNTWFALGSFLLFIILLVTQPFNLEPNAQKALACAILMILLWVSEALPMPVVALLPLVLFPMLGLADTAEVATPYANPVIFLFMGGFMIGLAIEKWELHRRIALTVVKRTGTSGSRIILGFILATGFLSMWLSNTATTMMMYPIAMSVVQVMEKNNTESVAMRNMGICLLLSIAYASNFGGIATLIGTPPNVVYSAYLKKQYNYNFQFADWMMIGTPIAFLLMGSLYLMLTKVLYRRQPKNDHTARQTIHNELQQLGPITTPEKRVLMVFGLTAFLWIFKDLINPWAGTRFDDNLIAVMGAILLFAIPSGDTKGMGKQLLDWTDTKNMAWGMLLLFGGGISMANQLEKAGLITSLGKWMAGSAGSNLLVLIFVITIVSIFISELLSNVGQVIVFAPVMTGMADAMQLDPLLLATPMVLAASCAGMLPMGTPPNAIVFASGRLRLSDMLKTGFVMNLMAVLFITIFCYYVLPVVVAHIR
ncbi:MAG TPA: DASS family sodium-coupled anion symporter [Phnomibacter sp.]|nr:DASS family sodium-coupled anion symporter [Phnomibacter sp.]